MSITEFRRLQELQHGVLRKINNYETNIEYAKQHLALLKDTDNPLQATVRHGTSQTYIIHYTDDDDDADDATDVETLRELLIKIVQQRLNTMQFNLQECVARETKRLAPLMET